MDNPKLKKADSKRVALGQRHEVNYCRKIARNIVKDPEVVMTRSIVRIAKAFLKATDELTEAKKSIKINHEVIDKLRKSVQEHSKRIGKLEFELSL